MVIRRALLSDIEAIARIYSDVHTAEENGTLAIGWDRNVYPTRETARSAIENSEMFVMEVDRQIVAAAIINNQQLPAYSGCDWLFRASDSEVCVLHTLVVDPNRTGKGYGTSFVGFYEDYAREHGFKVLRIDTQEKNSTARKFYAALGFREAGVVDCIFNNIPDIKIVCLEKKL